MEGSIGEREAPYLDLVGSVPTTIYSVFGVADMHLSYVVLRFPFAGVGASASGGAN